MSPAMTALGLLLVSYYISQENPFWEVIRSASKPILSVYPVLASFVFTLEPLKSK